MDHVARPPSRRLLSQAGHGCGVESATQETAERNVSHEMLRDRIRQAAPKLAEGDRVVLPLTSGFVLPHTVLRSAELPVLPRHDLSRLDLPHTPNPALGVDHKTELEILCECSRVELPRQCPVREHGAHVAGEEESPCCAVVPVIKRLDSNTVSS